MPLAPPWTAEAAAGLSLCCLKQIGGDPTSPAVVPSPAEPFLPKDYDACTCSHCPPPTLPPPPTARTWLYHPPGKIGRLFLSVQRPCSWTMQGGHFTRGAKTWGCETAPCAQRTPRGAAIWLSDKLPARLVFVALKGCIGGTCSAVVKCSTDAIFYYDVDHRVVARPK